METIVNLFYTPHAGDMVGVIQKDIRVVVSNGSLTAHYTSRQLLGGGIMACVDSQFEYDENTKAEAKRQFKMDCALACGANIYNLMAGSDSDGDERNIKVSHTFADPYDLVSYVTRNRLTLYAFCVVQVNDGEEQDYSDWVITLP